MASSTMPLVALTVAVLMLSIGGIEACNTPACRAACKAAGGVISAPPSPFLQRCAITIKVQGVARTFHVYFPPTFRLGRKYPAWIHLHGAFSIKMSVTTNEIYTKQKYLMQASEAFAYWEGVLTNNVAPGVIHIYPQSTGDARTRQIWNSEFWRCSVGYCTSGNDRAFLDSALLYMKQKLPINNKVFASGNSNGGMMLYTMICQSSVWAKGISGYVIQNSGIGKAYLEKCRPKGHVPIMQIHGALDPVIEVIPTKTVDNVWFAPQHSTARTLAVRTCTPKLREVSRTKVKCDASVECKGDKQGNTLVKCNEYCKQRKGSLRPTITLCIVTGSGHSTDAPYVGWHSQNMWRWIRNIASRP